MHPESLKITKIDPGHPFRFAKEEAEVLENLEKLLAEVMDKEGCHKAILVGHNPQFDLNFLQQAYARVQMEASFHAFTTFDTATLGAVFFGQTVLARAVAASGLSFDASQAHSALYDAERTASFFCRILNKV